MKRKYANIITNGFRLKYGNGSYLGTTYLEGALGDSIIYSDDCSERYIPIFTGRCTDGSSRSIAHYGMNGVAIARMSKTNLDNRKNDPEQYVRFISYTSSIGKFTIDILNCDIRLLSDSQLRYDNTILYPNYFNSSAPTSTGRIPCYAW